MAEMWGWISRVLKHGIAGSLFVLLLTGASAMVLLMLATAINGLPSEPATQAIVVTHPSGTSSPVQSLPTSPPASESTSVSEKTSSVQNDSSPIGEAIDRGGVTVGMHIQMTFGTVLTGLLQTLFLEHGNKP